MTSRNLVRRPEKNAVNRRLITDHNVRETLDIVDRAYILHCTRKANGIGCQAPPKRSVQERKTYAAVYIGDIPHSHPTTEYCASFRTDLRPVLHLTTQLHSGAHGPMARLRIMFVLQIPPPEG